MIQARNVCLSFGEQKVFDSINFTINQHQRIGLVGRNGSGKSTLLKVIDGMQHLDEGSIAISNKKSIAYMPQEVVLESDKSIIEETLTTFGDFKAIEQEIKHIDEQLEKHDPDVNLERYSELQTKMADYNPAQLKAQAQRVLTGLGFRDAQMDAPVMSLSVGWKMRVVLAKLLLRKADFYLFDEPTNHLDIVAKDWFMDFLQHSDFGFLLVSHERYFLDKLCDEILELEFGHATFYKGNYSHYVEQKEHNVELLRASQVQQQKEIKQKKANIERFRYSASRARQAQSMLKQLDKIELIELPPAPRAISFNFPIAQQPGKIVLKVLNLSQSFGEKHIFSHVNFEIERGEKVAVIAPNGVGKTTLFDIIIGALPVQKGSIELGYNVHPAILAQDQTKYLDGKKSIIDNIQELCPKKLENHIRTMLGAFLFSNDDVYKKVSVLSGGEKNRVGMVSVLLQDANFLLLDEPTNHLDLQSKEILLKALQSYKGTILFVSHDHDFINSLANRILELTPQGVHSYMGNYESFLYQKEQAAKLFGIKSDNSVVNEKSGQISQKKEHNHEAEKHCKKLEARVQKLEQDIKKIELSFEKIEYGTLEFNQTQKRLQKTKEEYEKTLAEWEGLVAASEQ